MLAKTEPFLILDLMKLVFLIPIFQFLALNSFSQIVVQPFPKQISCDIDFTDQLEYPTATSPCGKIKTRVSEEIFSGGCAGTLVRTFEFSDDCGNKEVAQQFISLKDTVEPNLLGVPTDVTVKEGEIPEIPHVLAMDNSKKMPTVHFSEEKKKGLIIRRWTTTDECDNTATAEQKIFISE